MSERALPSKLVPRSLQRLFASSILGSTSGRALSAQPGNLRARRSDTGGRSNCPPFGHEPPPSYPSQSALDQSLAAVMTASGQPKQCQLTLAETCIEAEAVKVNTVAESQATRRAREAKNAAGETWKNSANPSMCLACSSRLPERTSDTMDSVPNTGTRSF
jgi:hypothetical protein